MLNNEFYTAAEVAPILGVTVATLRTWRVSEKPIGPPFIRFESRTIRYRKKSVHAWLKAMERGETFDRSREPVRALP